MDTLPYQEMYDNTQEAIREDLSELMAVESDDADLISALGWSLFSAYYHLGVLEFVLRANRAGFHAALYRSCRTYLYLLAKKQAGLKIDGSFGCASNRRAIVSAVAIGEPELARELSALQTRGYDVRYDDKGLYALSMLVRLLVEGAADDGLRSAWAEFDEARAGHDTMARVLQAIVERDRDGFEPAMDAFLGEWIEIASSGDYEAMEGGVYPGDQGVCVQGLALVRLAEARDLTCGGGLRALPDELRNLSGLPRPTDGFPTP